MKLFGVSLILAISATGAVLDLGKLEVKGKVRGPDLSIVESETISERTISNVSINQLEELELKILKEPFKAEKKNEPASLQN